MKAKPHWSYDPTKRVRQKIVFDASKAPLVLNALAALAELQKTLATKE